MLRHDSLAQATCELMSAAILGEGWEGALTKLSRAAGARGVALIRNRQKRLVGAITNADIAEPVADFLSGKAPRSSRQIRVSHDGDVGFRVDHDDYTPSELDRDPFYQDFLRPIGAFWHANARLGYEPGEEVAISFKRDLVAGPYDRADATTLNAILGDVKAALRVAHRVLDAEAAGMTRMLHRRGDPVFELDSWGHVLRVHTAPDEGELPLRISGRRLVAPDQHQQRDVDRAFHQAATLQSAAAALLLGDRGERFILQMLPVSGAGRDVFTSTAAIAVLLRQRVTGAARAREGRQLSGIFRFTDRESEIALLLLQGMSLNEIALQLGIRINTARFHLKSIFDKCRTSRQAELVGLLARLLS